MLTRSRALLATFALVVLFMTVSGASANRLSLNNETFRIVWDPMTFITRAGTRITCKVTFEGTFASRVISKTGGAQIGSITAASFERCSETMRFLTETLPWPIAYRDFIGSLPNIEQMGTTFTRINFKWGLISTCLYTVVAENPLSVYWVRRETTSQIILVQPEPPMWIRSVDWWCPSEDIRMSGSGAATIRSGFEALFLTLAT
jgi:hypothetical protein